jgi:DUF1009 family protein
VIRRALKEFFFLSRRTSPEQQRLLSERSLTTPDKQSLLNSVQSAGVIGLIAGNGTFPLRFMESAQQQGCRVVAVAHENETIESIADLCEELTWIRVGQLGKIISTFREAGVRYAAMAGGINRVKHFGDVKLDSRGAKLMLKLRSTKDDVIMRGIADELLTEGIEVVDCTLFLPQCLAQKGLLAGPNLSDDEWADIGVGVEAIKAMSPQDIGQVVVVREGVIVAVEAVEGTDATVLRGGNLAGPGAVVVKFAKTTQDMRFDVPTVGLQTVKSMEEVGIRVLALEAGRSLIIDKEEVFNAAQKAGISIVGCDPLVE